MSLLIPFFLLFLHIGIYTKYKNEKGTWNVEINKCYIYDYNHLFLSS